MRHIGLLYNPQREGPSRLAAELAATLSERGVEVWCGSTKDDALLRLQAPKLEILITLGGDGTIVHAVRCIAEFGLPILGINFGRLGFLAEVDPSHVHAAVADLSEHNYTVEERMMLHTEVLRGEELLLEAEAINDVVVARGLVSRTVQISIEVDSHHVITPTADGVVVSTPTGSTAYCLAAGGPIVAPDLNCLTITPIAAHLGIARALVIPADRSLTLRLVQGNGAVATVDGQLDIQIRPGDRVSSTASLKTAKFIRFGKDGYFYETVFSRLRWPDQSGSA